MNQPTEKSQLPAVIPPKESAPLSMRLMQRCWSQRHLAVRGIHTLGSGLSWLYNKFPLPQRVKDITTELTYHFIEHFIVQSDGYQAWLQRRDGLGRLHRLFKIEREDVVATPFVEPTEDEWNILIRDYDQRFETMEDKITTAVIVPVYKGYTETLRCLYQLLQSTNQRPFHLTLINDASPDTALIEKLRALAQVGWFEWIEQPRNEGFVRTVNAGMAKHPDCDIVLLNADTEVYDGWLDRLIEALYHRDDVASVTPFSNNAELCSYPIAFHTNPAQLELSYERLDQLASHCFSDYPELPTAVGFCMAMRRRAIDEVGVFDDALFGRGYGEENDWCLRASAQGWRHVMAPNVFVRHSGSVSFAAQKRRELNRSLRKLNARHPHYRKLVRDFRNTDPLLAYRRQLDMARIQLHCINPTFLVISHNAGGGTERHIQDMTARLEEEQMDILRLNPDATQASKIRLWHPSLSDTPNLIFHLDHEHDALQDCLRQFQIQHMHVHHLIGFPQSMAHWIMKTADALRCRYDITIHDYFMACPSINLLMDHDYVSHNPSLEESQQWAKQHPSSAAGRTPIWLWREKHRQFMRDARRVYTPSEDTANRMQHFFPDIDMYVRPHPEEALHITPPNKIHRPGEAIEIAVFGHLTKHKGYDVIHALAKDAAARDIPILFHLFGDIEKTTQLKKTGHVIIHGAYKDDDIPFLLKQHRCHAVLIPSIWPETYSYTLSIALQHKIYPVCFDIGAPAERLRAADWGKALPVDWINRPTLVNDILLAMNIAPAPKAVFIPDGRERYVSIIRDYYQLELKQNAIQPARFPVKE